jgi:menaquinol-cytochrome c reductase cytochrome b/c subunit
MSLMDQRRAQFKRYKEDVKDKGKPFFPYAMWEDTIMAFVVVAVIICLAVIWKFTVPGNHTSTAAGWLGPLYSSPADPGTVSFVPRPDWYFYFLFYLLRIFKWPESVILGTVGIPTLCLVLLIGLPFYDTRLERKPLRRPVAMVALALVVLSMGVLTYKGAAAKEALASEVIGSVPSWVQKNNLPPEAIPGAKLFAQSGCTSCHTYLGVGSSNLGAPDLSDIGSKNLGIDFQINHLKCPSCVNAGSPMPSFASLGDEALHQLAIFLEASKGPQ